jgi:hypothetical protein
MLVQRTLTPFPACLLSCAAHTDSIPCLLALLYPREAGLWSDSCGLKIRHSALIAPKFRIPGRPLSVGLGLSLR